MPRLALRRDRDRRAEADRPLDQPADVDERRGGCRTRGDQDCTRSPSRPVPSRPASDLPRTSKAAARPGRCDPPGRARRTRSSRRATRPNRPRACRRARCTAPSRALAALNRRSAGPVRRGCPRHAKGDGRRGSPSRGAGSRAPPPPGWPKAAAAEAEGQQSPDRDERGSRRIVRDERRRDSMNRFEDRRDKRRCTRRPVQGATGSVGLEQDQDVEQVDGQARRPQHAYRDGPRQDREAASAGMGDRQAARRRGSASARDQTRSREPTGRRPRAPPAGSSPLASASRSIAPR